MSDSSIDGVYCHKRYRGTTRLCGPFGLASVGGRLVAADHHTLAELVDGGVGAHEIGVQGLRGLAAVHGELLATTEAGELRCGTVGGRWHRVADGLDRPCGLVAAGGEVLVAESGAARVVRVGRAGELDPVASGFDRPVDLAVADGEVWVSDAGRGQVVRLSDGLVVAAGLARPEGLVAHRGALVVVEAAAGRLTRVDPRTRTSTPVVGNLPLATQPPHVPAYGSGTGSIAQRPAPHAALTVHDDALAVGLKRIGSVLRVGCQPFPRRAGKPPVAIGPQRSTVRRIRVLSSSAMACLYSSQSGCSPEMERKYSTSGSRASGMSRISAVPSTCTHGPSKSSESMHRATRGSRRMFVTFARSG